MVSHLSANRPQITDLDTALERIHQLEDLLGYRWHAPIALRLSGAEEKILGAIMSRPQIMDYESLYVLMYGLHADPPQIEVIKVLVCHLRKKTDPYDIFIETIWGRGLLISKENRAKIDALYEDHERKPEAA